MEYVAHWLSWALREFSLGSGAHIDSFISSLSMSGKELCAMNKQNFITRAPLFMGDILWAHLEILQKESDQIVSKTASVPFYLPQHPLPPASISKTYTDLEPAPAVSSSLLPAHSSPSP